MYKSNNPSPEKLEKKTKDYAKSVHTNSKVLSLEGGQYHKLVQWNLKHQIGSSNFYKLLIKNKLVG